MTAENHTKYNATLTYQPIIERLRSENMQLKEALDRMDFQSQCSWCEKNAEIAQQALRENRLCLQSKKLDNGQ